MAFRSTENSKTVIAVDQKGVHTNVKEADPKMKDTVAAMVEVYLKSIEGKTILTHGMKSHSPEILKNMETILAQKLAAMPEHKDSKLITKV